MSQQTSFDQRTWARTLLRFASALGWIVLGFVGGEIIGVYLWEQWWRAAGHSLYRALTPTSPVLAEIVGFRLPDILLAVVSGLIIGWYSSYRRVIFRSFLYGLGFTGLMGLTQFIVMYPLGTLIEFNVLNYVATASFIVAIAWLVAWVRRVPSSLGRCVKCDYDLTGNTSGVCPECGAPL